jgi:hypothetical protein
MAIWHTARFDPEEHKGYGWLGRALDPQAGTSYALCGSVPGALRGRRSTALTLGRLEEMFLLEPAALKQDATGNNQDDLLAFVRRQAVDARTASKQLAHVTGGNDTAKYPSTGLAERLNLAARLLKSNLGARVFYTTQSGFDTHAAQEDTRPTEEPRPSARARRTISSATRSFLLEPGLRYSSLARIRPSSPRRRTIWRSFTRGVAPIAPRIESASGGGGACLVRQASRGRVLRRESSWQRHLSSPTGRPARPGAGLRPSPGPRRATP